MNILVRLAYDGTAYCGFQVQPNGISVAAVFQNALESVLGFRPDYIEHQLAHAVRDPNGRAYNRTSHLAERRKMMQAWADYLDRRRDDTGKVLEFKKSGSRR